MTARCTLYAGSRPDGWWGVRRSHHSPQIDAGPHGDVCVAVDGIEEAGTGAERAEHGRAGLAEGEDAEQCRK